MYLSLPIDDRLLLRVMELIREAPREEVEAIVRAVDEKLKEVKEVRLSHVVALVWALSRYALVGVDRELRFSVLYALHGAVALAAAMGDDEEDRVDLSVR